MAGERFNLVPLIEKLTLRQDLRWVDSFVFSLKSLAMLLSRSFSSCALSCLCLVCLLVLLLSVASLLLWHVARRAKPTFLSLAILSK